MSFKLSRLQLILALILLILVLALLLELILAPQLLRGSLAATHYKAGRYDKASRIYQQLREQKPRDQIAPHNEAKAMYKKGDFPAASSTLKDLETKRKNDPGLEYDLGNAAFKQNDFKAAVDHYKQAILLDPKDYDAKANYELALRKLNEQQQKAQNQPQAQPRDPGEQKKEENPDYDNVLGALDQREALDRQQTQKPRVSKPKNWW